MSDLNECSPKCRLLVAYVENGFASARCRWDDHTTIQLMCKTKQVAGEKRMTVVAYRCDKCLAEKVFA